MAYHEMDDEEIASRCRGKYMRLADERNEEGFTDDADRAAFRASVGEHLLELSPYDGGETAGVCLNTASFCVLAYLHHAPLAPTGDPAATIDFGSFRQPNPRTWVQRDVLDACRTLGAHWRSLHRVPSAYVRALEGVAGNIARDEDRAWPPDALEDVCMTLAYVWALECTWDTFIHDKWEDFEADAATHERCMAWCVEAKEMARRAKRAGNMALRLGRASVHLGETERYARANGGVKAADVKTVFDATRTHVQSRAADAMLARVDMNAASRLATLSYVNRYMATKYNFAFSDFSVVLDTDFVGSVLRAISARRSTPWIMLFGCDYYVFFRDAPCRRCPDAVHAAILWFSIMKDEYDLVLPDGLDTYDFTGCARDKSFPFV